MIGTQISIEISRQPERLVVEGVRRMMAGYDTADSGCWELAWQFYKKELGGQRARRPNAELAHYARALHDHGTRRLCLFPYDCRKLCQDECLVASLIAAAQADDGQALEAIGAALVCPEGLGETLYSACEFGDALKACGLVLQAIDFSRLSLKECPLKQFSARVRH
jgi:hypothetical protein